jgi:large subunit ribosomal protein L11
MPKKVVKVLKLNLPAGQATPAPPIGPILGQAGINMMDFIKQYNERTAEKQGQIIPAEISIYEDRSFSFELKLPPVSALIKQEIDLDVGSHEPKTDIVGEITMDQVKKVAEKKLPDLNTDDIDAAMNTVIGTAKSMGVEVKE